MSTSPARPRGEDGEVLAAGGLVLRSGATGPEVLVVHRPHRGDWSFPKGHLDAGEGFEQAAVREVEEETGLRCRLVDPLGPVRYVDARGRPKLVRYWTMERLDGEFVANDEVDEVRWVDVPGAASLLSYDADRELVNRVALRRAP